MNAKLEKLVDFFLNIFFLTYQNKLGAMSVCFKILSDISF